MRDENYYETQYNPDHDGGIYAAVHAWCREPAAAKARYGPIASWDTSGITSMYRLFHGQAGFNEDISRWNVSNVWNMNMMLSGATSYNGDLSSWNVSNVGSMHYMFSRATSFDRQLDGAWSTSTASKYRMFDNSPGTIAGRTKRDDGSIGTVRTWREISWH